MAPKPQTYIPKITKSLLQRTIGIFNVKSDMIVEKDPEDLRKCEREKPMWQTYYNAASGLTSVKTLKVHREDSNQKAKDLATTLYVPPPPIEKVRTFGKFHDVTVPTSSDHFLVDRDAQFYMNPRYLD